MDIVWELLNFSETHSQNCLKNWIYFGPKRNDLKLQISNSLLLESPPIHIIFLMRLILLLILKALLLNLFYNSGDGDMMWNPCCTQLPLILGLLPPHNSKSASSVTVTLRLKQKWWTWSGLTLDSIEQFRAVGWVWNTQTYMLDGWNGNVISEQPAYKSYSIRATLDNTDFV